MHYDFVISCFEPVHRVTGGIGTYTRLLLEIAPQFAARTLFLTSGLDAADTPLADTIEVERLPASASLGHVAISNLLDPLSQHAFNVQQTLAARAARGDTFGLVEVPDYGAEGVFIARALRQGSLAVDTLAVRLHSPVLMLHADNAQEPFLDVDGFRAQADERLLYEHADVVLYGGQAMRDRVATLVPSPEAFKRKCVAIAHPWPAPRASPQPVREPGPKRIGYVGRLEYRKGVDLLVRAAVRALESGTAPFELHLYGRDTSTWRGTSVRDALSHLIPPRHAAAFVFHDRVSQAELLTTHLPQMDGFVFPSRFENYPNALLEVLELGAPVLASRHGCMEEMASGFAQVDTFEPEDLSSVGAWLERRVGRVEVGAIYAQRRATLHAQLRDGYRALVARPRRGPTTPKRRPALTVLVTHHARPQLLKEALASVKPQLREKDSLLVVDDGSPPMLANEAAATAKHAGARFIGRLDNGGPSAARNAGLAAIDTELVTFLDGDDRLPAGALEHLRAPHERDERLDLTQGPMRLFGAQDAVWMPHELNPRCELVRNTMHIGVLARTSLLRRLGGFDVEQRLHVEDWELFMRLSLAGARSLVVPHLTYEYRVDQQAGRQSRHHIYLGFSEDRALRVALRSMTPDDVVRAWPALLELLIARARQPETAPQEAPLRHRLADKLNTAIKRSLPGVQGALKALLR